MTAVSCVRKKVTHLQDMSKQGSPNFIFAYLLARCSTLLLVFVIWQPENYVKSTYKEKQQQKKPNSFQNLS